MCTTGILKQQNLSPNISQLHSIYIIQPPAHNWLLMPALGYLVLASKNEGVMIPGTRPLDHLGNLNVPP